MPNFERWPFLHGSTKSVLVSVASSTWIPRNRVQFCYFKLLNCNPWQCLQFKNCYNIIIAWEKIWPIVCYSLSKKFMQQFLPLNLKSLGCCHHRGGWVAGWAMWTPKFMNMITRELSDVWFSKWHHICFFFFFSFFYLNTGDTTHYKVRGQIFWTSCEHVNSRRSPAQVT